MPESEEGANDNQRLLAAAREDNEVMLLGILETGNFDINFQDGVGNTALHIAVQNGSTYVLEHILCHAECDVDPINRIDRATPLHLACRLEHDEMRFLMVDSLLEAGADTEIRDKNGELAASFVPQNDGETRRLFRKAQARAMTVSQDDIASDDDDHNETDSDSDSESGSDED